jgi:arabinan endo-1,5-alpha-L-arabinosidase
MAGWLGASPGSARVAFNCGGRMIRRVLSSILLAALAAPALTLGGQVGIHDPLTVVVCDGKYYTFGTGGTALVSDDGWTWRAGTRASRSGMAPDLIHIGDRYYQYIAANIGGLPRAQITMISSKTLDPSSPDYQWEDGGVVCSTDGIEDCNGIDPGAVLDPTDGKLWLSYGSYFGFIRPVQLDPKTGKRLDPNDEPYDNAINTEATDIIYRDGWYYLFGTHGSCCRGRYSRPRQIPSCASAALVLRFPHEDIDHPVAGGAGAAD